MIPIMFFVCREDCIEIGTHVAGPVWVSTLKRESGEFYKNLIKSIGRVGIGPERFISSSDRPDLVRIAVRYRCSPGSPVYDIVKQKVIWAGFKEVAATDCPPTTVQI